MKSPKQGRKPNPLTLAPAENPKSLIALSPGSFALQDAAVSSATNLLAVVNDILWSPPLSAAALPRSPIYPSLPSGRPRSHTAPSTPGETSHIAELPGSLLQENQGYPINHRTSEGRARLGPEKTPPGLNLGFDVEKLNTSLRQSGNVSKHRRSASENNAVAKHRSKQDSNTPIPLIRRNFSDDPSSNFGRRSLIANDTGLCHELGSSSLHQHSRMSSQPSFGLSNDIVRQENVQVHEKVSAHEPQTDLQAAIADRDRSISFLTTQLGNLQRSHDAYIASLRQAHDKELGALKVYASCLEEQQGLSSRKHPEPDGRSKSARKARIFCLRWSLNNAPGKLHLETKLYPSQLSPSVAEGNSANSLLSFQSALEEHQRASQEMATEMESLKRKLSFAQKRDAESDINKKEIHILRETVKSKQQHVEVLMRKLMKAQTIKKAADNTAEALEGRLEMANAQKNDVLEENHELRQAALNLHRRERAMRQELQTVCQRRSESEQELRDRFREAEERADRLEQALQVFRTNQDTEPALVELNKHVQRLEEGENERNHYITRLEQELRQCRFQIDNIHIPQSLQPTASAVPSRRRDSSNNGNELDLATSRNKISQLDQALEQRDASIKSLEAERNNIRALLQAEIRAQACKASDQLRLVHSAVCTKADMDKILAEVQDKAHTSLAPPSTPHWKIETDPIRRIEQLEKEIDYHVNDIVLYKLDVKGYKKDLKHANAKIQTIQGLSVKSSPNPDSASVSHRTSSNAPISASSQTQTLPDWPETSTTTGLGIFSPVLDARRPPRKDPLPPLASAGGNSSSNVSLAPPLSRDTASNRTPSASPSVSPRPRTPAATNKKLPRTPMTPPPSDSSKSGKAYEQILTPSVPTAPPSRSPRPRRSTDTQARTAFSTMTPVRSPTAAEAAEDASVQRLDRSLSESVVEVLSGSPQMKASLSLYPSPREIHPAPPILVGGKKNLKKITGRRAKSTTAVVPLSIEFDRGNGRTNSRDGQANDSRQ
ncbi:MAG: hypothetical protein Q9157_000890 [Trypethelium eluteriae]